MEITDIVQKYGNLIGFGMLQELFIHVLNLLLSLCISI